MATGQIGFVTVSTTTGTGNGQIENSANVFKGRVIRSQVIRVTPTGGTADSYTVNQTPETEFLTVNSPTVEIAESATFVDISGTSNSAKLNFVFKTAAAWATIPSTYTVTSNGGTAKTATVNANIPDDPGATDVFSWSIRIAVQTNTGVSSRSFSINVVAGGGTGSLTQEVAVTQKAGAPTLSINPSTMSFVAVSAGVQILTITSNTSWTVTSNQTWCTVGSGSGSGSGSVNINCATHTGRSNRTATVTVSTSAGSPAVTRTLTVTQTGATAFISFDQSTYTVGKAGGNVTVTGKANTPNIGFSSTNLIVAPIPTTYTVNGSITASTTGTPIPGDPGATTQFTFSIVFAVSANLTILLRNSDISGICTTPNASGGCTISQSAGDVSLSVSPKTITIPTDGTAQTVTVTSNTSWTVS